jgi:hypothetical protein
MDAISSCYARRVLRPLLVLAAAILVAVPSIAAPPSQPPNLDHFRCYPVLNSQLPLIFVVTLKDQFDRADDPGDQFFTGFPLRFCNPVAKTPVDRGPGMGPPGHISDPDHHLTLYGLVPVRTRTELTWRVQVENQFGRQTLSVLDARGLMVPTHKMEPGLDPPEGLNHFKCYRASGRKIQVVVTLEDQFETTEVLTAQPEVFCNPAEKTVGRTTTPVEDPDAHLVCYEIKPTASLIFTTLRNVPIDNQFVPNPPAILSVADSEDILCVPSRKLFAIGFPGALKAAP